MALWNHIMNVSVTDLKRNYANLNVDFDLWKKESDAISDTENTVSISLEQKDGGWYLHTNLYDFLPENTDGIISTETLGIAFEPEQKYENPDGSPIIFNQDFSGEHRDPYLCRAVYK